MNLGKGHAGHRSGRRRRVSSRKLRHLSGAASVESGDQRPRLNPCSRSLSTSARTRDPRSSPWTRTEGLVRGMDGAGHRRQHHGAGRRGQTLGRIINVIGEPVDEARPDRDRRRTTRSIARHAAVHRPGDRGRRRSRPASRSSTCSPRTPAAARSASSAAPASARPCVIQELINNVAKQHGGLLGVRRRRRAHPRGQRSLARDDASRASSPEGRAGVRPDERAAGRAPASASPRSPSAEYFRDDEGKDVLLFIDNIFRFTQANSEVSALLGRMPSRRRLPADAVHRPGRAPGAHHHHQEGLDHLGAGDLRARRRPHRPGAGDRPSPTSTRRRCSRARSPSSASTPPSIRSTRRRASSIRNVVGEEHYRVARQVQEMLQRYKDLQDIIAILGMDELSGRGQAHRRARAQDPAASSRSRSTSPRRSPAAAASYVKLAGHDPRLQGDRRRQARRRSLSRRSTCRARSKTMLETANKLAS